MYDFNSISNRLMKSHIRDFGGILNQFIQFIEERTIIKAYLDDCGAPTIPDIEAEVKDVARSYGRSTYTTGGTPTEETANVLSVLRYLAENQGFIEGSVMGYSASKQYSDMLKEFNERFVLILIRNIEGYLTKMGIEMGLDESTRFIVTVHNGQFNLATDSSTVNASIYNGVDQGKLQELLNSLTSKSKIGLSDEELDTVSESVELIQQEMKSDKPKKSILRGVLTTLKGVKGTAEFLAALAALTQFVQPFIGP